MLVNHVCVVGVCPTHGLTNVMTLLIHLCIAFATVQTMKLNAHIPERRKQKQRYGVVKVFMDLDGIKMSAFCCCRSNTKNMWVR